MGNNDIIKRIEVKLSELRMSKAQFYKESGVSSATYSQWNTGKFVPSEKKLKSVAECLGVTVEYLKGEEKEKPTANEDDELAEYLEMLKNRPECRMLFQLSKDATKADVEEAVRIIEAIRNK